MEIQTSRYDNPLSLRELMSGFSPDRLSGVLAALYGAPVRVVSADGTWVMGDIPPLAGAGVKLPLQHDLETVAYLEAGAPENDAAGARIRAVAEVLGVLMQTGARYLMASRLHQEVVNSDYEELQSKHAALAVSEARYRELAGSLEQKVSEQVQTIATAHRQLYHAEKLASVGQLAAGVAHEINNPIGFIRSNLGMAQTYVQKLQGVAGVVKSSTDMNVSNVWETAEIDFVLQDFSALLGESMDGADRVARIVSDLKDFSRVDQAKEGMVDVNECIRSACNVAAGQISGRATLGLELADLPALHGNAGHLSQVFLNLLLNAVQSIGQRGEIMISSGVSEGRIVIRISDTGCGIPPDVLPRIFDPFYTTRSVGSGTGLGLTVSRDIITAHGGSMEVSSELNRGTTFAIYLPFGKESA